MHDIGRPKKGETVVVTAAGGAVGSEPFISMDHQARFDEIEAGLLPRVRRGELRSRGHVIEGLTAAPAALHRLFDGTNTGKLLVRVGHS
ncbi:hypothetical protein PV341_13070 [Streptomyces sp. PA03-1a]|nr:hypothetical protein [Streptomyces sp. PA03-1a]MDX2816268.1 hypothetical protein [Streptomyces sp. PA03-5A]